MTPLVFTRKLRHAVFLTWQAFNRFACNIFIPDIPDRHLYLPLFSPWEGDPDFQPYFDATQGKSLVSADRCYILYSLLKQAYHLPGDVWECGTYRGGTAAMLAKILADLGGAKKLYLFDTFEGMPATDPEKDFHQAGDFSDTSFDMVASTVGYPEITRLKKGWIPETFQGLESETIAFAHIDVDIYRSIMDSLEFIWPRLSIGGFVVFDDYGISSCPGARAAVDTFFSGQPYVPVCLPTGQAIVFKGH